MEHEQHDRVVSELIAMTQVEFVKVLRRAFLGRSAELDQRYFQCRYALAIVGGYPARPSRPEEWAVEVVATPTIPAVDSDTLGEQGSCPVCGFEAIAEAKQARCGICEAVVGLT